MRRSAVPLTAAEGGLLLLLLACTFVFSWLAYDVAHGRTPAVDRLVGDQLSHQEDRSRAIHVLGLLGTLGSVWGGLVISALVLVFLVVSRRVAMIGFFIPAVAVSAANPLLKDAFSRPARTAPFLPPVVGYFPSGHATGSMAVCAAVVALAWSTRFRVVVVAVCSCAVFIVGLSAYYNGDHWPSDVLAGWALALGWVSMLCLVMPVPRRRGTA